MVAYPGTVGLEVVRTIGGILKEVQCSPVAQSWPTLCDPMNRSTPGLPVHHQLRSPPRPTSTESVKSLRNLMGSWSWSVREREVLKLIPRHLCKALEG